ncbi:MAG: acetyl-CoA decarbonylase/synthase complex subunit gamma [Deltaproteobacteria bacterium]|nr:acetyl-CoA decarbonylase/synthase complex subunit gamma [Deltaproteobacteria bacterium]
MALKGADILKSLPKTNCKECGFPTCFAFAMKIATGGAKLDQCPHINPESKAELEALLAPPMKLVTIGTGDKAMVIGEEEVLFRHEKSFFRETAIAILLSDDEEPGVIDEKLRKIQGFHFERIGQKLNVNLVAVSHDSQDKGKYTSLVKKAMEFTDMPLLLVSCETEALLEAAALCARRRPLVYPITKENVGAALPKLKELKLPVGVWAKSLEELAGVTAQLQAEGIEEMVLDPGSKNMLEAVRDQTLIRRSALKKGFRPLGYPTMAFPCFMYSDKFKEALAAAACIAKYAGIVVLNQVDERFLLPVLVQRFNIYTDPRRPMTVEEKAYEILNPDENSPILISTNYALDYFIVSGAIEEAGIPAYLAIKNTDGLGVLAAWTSGKFNGEAIAEFIKKFGIENKVKHRKLIIPGVARKLKGELEEELPGWEIILGPQEASEIPKFLAEKWSV